MAATMRPGLASLPLIYPEVELTLPVCIGQRTIPLGHELTVARAVLDAPEPADQGAFRGEDHRGCFVSARLSALADGR